MGRIILNACKKSGSILLLSVVVLMCISALGITFFRGRYSEIKKQSMYIKDTDMYDKGNYNEVLISINNYFAKSAENINSMKERSFFIDNYIFFYFDNLQNKFCVDYKYRGIKYSRKLRYIEENNKVIFVPQEKKYIS